MLLTLLPKYAKLFWYRDKRLQSASWRTYMRKTKDQNRLARERIVAALTELMSEQDYTSITITEITQRAGVSRMTYYRNYSSKEDILRNNALRLFSDKLK